MLKSKPEYLWGKEIKGEGMGSQGDVIVDEDEKELGTVTSGTFSPSLKGGIGLAYVPSSFTNKQLHIKVRKRVLTANLCKRDFLKA